MFQKPAFGANTSGFGMHSTFGQPTTAAASPFGGFKPAAAGGAFGAPPAFGAAAATQPAQPVGMFGAPNTTGGLFGATATTAQPAAFGASTSGFGFGANNTTGGGLFANNTTGGGLFGQTQTNTAFGAKPPGFGFGATTSNATTGGGLFGNTAQAGTSLFGQQNNTMAGGLFANNTGGFGQPAVAQQTGTAHVKYNPLVGTDVVVKSGTSQNINIKHHCITCMKEYENKSLEELRLEDYTAGRKGATGGVFGFQQESKPLFGAPNTFGQPATTSAPSVFGGALSTGGFGQTNTFSFGGNTQANTNTTGLFGGNKPGFGATNTTGTGLFGAAASTQAPTFGTNTSTFGFGSNLQNQNTGGMFGAKPATTGFGAAPTTGFGAFGTGGGLFGAKPAQTQAPTFGAPQSGVGSLAGGFGTATSSAGLFGSSFGKPATTQSSFGFGAAQPTLGLNTGLNSTFQAKPAVPGFGVGSGLFPQPQANTFRTGLDSGLGGGFFSNNATLGNSSLGLGMNANNSAFGNNSLAGASAVGNVHEQILSLAARPYGDSPLFKDLPDSGNSTELALKPTNPAAQAVILARADAHRVTSPPAIRLSLHPRAPAQDKKSLFDGLEEADSSLSDKLSLKPSRKRLVLRQKQRTNDSYGDIEDTGSSFRQDEQHTEMNGAAEKENISTGLDGAERVRSNVDTSTYNDEITSEKQNSWMSASKVTWTDKEPALDAETPRLYPHLAKEIHTEISERRSSWLTTKVLRKPQASNPDSVESSVRELGVRPATQSPATDRDTDLLFVSESPPAREMPPHPAGIKCTRPGYYTIPALDELTKYLRPDGSCVVPHFTVGRTNYGNVYFDQEMDVAGLDIDALVHFLNKEVIIYPEEVDKPPVGSGLNRRAIVTLDRVWPRDKTENRLITDPQRLLKVDYEGKLRRVSDKHDTKFIEYRPQTGSWVFRVEHFSKYGLTDSDEEDDPIPDVLKRQLVNQGLQKNAAPASLAIPLPAPPIGLGGLGGPLAPLSGPLAPLSGPLAPLSGPLAPLSGLVSEDAILAMQQSSINLLSGAGKAFDMDTTEDNAESQSLYQDNRAFGVKSPTSELARLEHRQSAHVQLMKASLYAEPEMEDDVSISTGDQLVPLSVRSEPSAEPTVPARSHHAEVVDPAPVIAEEQTRLDTSTGRKDRHHTSSSRELHMRPLMIQPHTIVLQYHRRIPPFKKTIAGRLNAACIADMAVSRARHSRVAFGPRTTLVLPTTFNSLTHLPKNAELSDLTKYVCGRTEDDWSEPIVTRLALQQPDKHYNVQEVLCKQLESLFQFSTFTKESDVNSALQLTTEPRERYAALKQLIQDAETNVQEQRFGVGGAYRLEVWKLCDALWGADLENDGIPGSDDGSIVDRHRRLLTWLTAAVADATDADLAEPAPPEPEDESDTHSGRIWTLMLGGRLLEASQTARDAGDLNLAALLAQSAGDASFRGLISRQLSLWRSCGAASLVSGRRLALLALLAGEPPSDLAAARWTQALLATAKYICTSVPSLETVIRRYEEMFPSSDPELGLALVQQEEMGMRKPVPHYLPAEAANEINAQTSHLDLRYELIRARAFNLRPRLRPEQYTPDPFDYSLCFVLGVWLGHPSLESIVGVADLLEASGDWHRAVHALCYLKDDAARGRLIRGVLSRHAPAKADTPELSSRLELMQRLRIPQAWTLEAQAHRAKYEHLPLVEATHLVDAGQWNAAHRVLLEEILPEAVLADNLQSLAPLLEKMSEAAARSEVANWQSGGEALHCYLHVCDEIRGLVCGAGGGEGRGGVHARLEALRPALAAACRALQGLTTHNPRHAAARAEMGARLIQLAVAAGSPPARLAALLTALRLPPDCAAAAHHKITNDLAEQASELCIESTNSSPISAHQRATAT